MVEVSVVMAVRDGGSHLRGALESILSQQGVDLELVVVNDGSTDGSASLLRELAAKDGRLRVLEQENQGLTRSLRLGCSVARGELIARQDADDLSAPGRLQRQVAMLRSEPSLVAVGCFVRTVGPADEPLYVTTFEQDHQRATAALIERGVGPVHGSVTFRRQAYELVGGYRPEFYFAQDVDLWARLTERGLLGFVPEVLYDLRVSPGSITGGYRPSQQKLSALAREAASCRRRGVSEEEVLKAAMTVRPDQVRSAGQRDWGLYFIGRCLTENRDPRAMSYLRQFTRKRPFSPRGWWALGRALALRGMR